LEEDSDTGDISRSWILLMAPAPWLSDEAGFVAGIFLLIILLLLSALVSASEVAFFSINPVQQRKLEQSPVKADQLILASLQRPRRTLASIVISNTLFNVAIVAIVYVLVTARIPGGISAGGSVILVLSLALVLVLFAEVLPKQYASHNNIRVARLTVMPLTGIAFVFSPVVKMLVFFSDLINKQLEKSQKPVTPGDVQHAIDLAGGKEEGLRDTRMLKRIVNFSNLKVTEIQQSRMDVVAVEKDVSYPELLEVVRESGYSRIPVYLESFDYVVGIVYTKDLLPHIGAPDDFCWQELIREPLFVPESKKIDSLLEEFRHKRIHMAIVVDEFGGCSGIVTLEDVLEEVIGEIKDEFDDIEEVEYKRIDKYNYIFEGKTQIIDFCNLLDLPADIFDEVRGEADTLAGLLLELKNEMPKTGEIIHHGQFVFKVLTVNKARISRIRVTLVSQENGAS
jgi:putative hemolysin